MAILMSAPIHPPVSSAAGLLGGRRILHAQPRQPMEWVALVRQGLPAASVDSLVRSTHLTQSQLAQALAIPERTLVRRKREGALSPDESAKVVRLARVVERAEGVFESTEVALNWLQAANAALGGVSPLSLLDTEIGAESVLDTLGRIEHGVFA
jgi:putative toxin-antitoxin system antitoxin component (TIGR02293 family)